MRFKHIAAWACVWLCLSAAEGLAEDFYTQPIPVPRIQTQTGGMLREQFSSTDASMEYWDDLSVSEPVCRMSDDGKTMFIDRPLVTGGTGSYTYAYNIYDSQGQPVNYFYSDAPAVAATCPYNGIFNVYVVVSDGRASQTVMTGWFQVSAYEELKIGEISWQLSRDGRSCFIQKPTIIGAEGPVSIAYNIYDDKGQPVNYFYSDAPAVAATCPQDGLYNVYVVVSDSAHSVIGMTGWFSVDGYHGVISVDDGLNGAPALQGQPVELTVLTAKSVKTIALFSENGLLMQSWSDSSLYQDEDAVRVWKVSYAFAQHGIWKGTIRGSENGSDYRSERPLMLTVSQLPCIIQVQPVETEWMVGSEIHLKVITSASVNTLGLFDADGMLLQRYDAQTDAEREEAELIWQTALVPQAAGELSLLLRAAPQGEEWIEQIWYIDLQIDPRNVDGFTFELAEDEAMITGYIGTASRLMVPDQADGQPVTMLADSALEGLQNIVSVSLPASVCRIGQQAFAGCTALEEVSMYDTVTEIGDYAFDGCLSLKTIAITP